MNKLNSSRRTRSTSSFSFLTLGRKQTSSSADLSKLTRNASTSTHDFEMQDMSSSSSRLVGNNIKGYKKFTLLTPEIQQILSGVYELYYKHEADYESKCDNLTDEDYKKLHDELPLDAQSYNNIFKLVYGEKLSILKNIGRILVPQIEEEIKIPLEKILNKSMINNPSLNLENAIHINILTYSFEHKINQALNYDENLRQSYPFCTKFNKELIDLQNKFNTIDNLADLNINYKDLMCLYSTISNAYRLNSSMGDNVYSTEHNKTIWQSSTHARLN